MLNRQVAELEKQIEQSIAPDVSLTEAAKILRSIPGIGPIVNTMLMAEMPGPGQISGEQAAALTGLAPSRMTVAPCARNERLVAGDDCCVT